MSEADFNNQPKKVVPVSHEAHSSKVRIITPADPEKVAAWRASKEGMKRTTKQFNAYKGEWKERHDETTA